MTACTPDLDARLAERASERGAAHDDADLDRHLADCPRCRAALARYQEAFALAAVPAPAASADLATAVLLRDRAARRRHRARLLVGGGLVATAAAAALVLLPAVRPHHGRSVTAPSAARSSWEPDVDGVLEASAITDADATPLASSSSYGSTTAYAAASSSSDDATDDMLAAYDAAEDY